MIDAWCRQIDAHVYQHIYLSFGRQWCVAARCRHRTCVPVRASVGRHVGMDGYDDRVYDDACFRLRRLPRALLLNQKAG
jgi:hypothetical protein